MSLSLSSTNHDRYQRRSEVGGHVIDDFGSSIVVFAVVVASVLPFALLELLALWYGEWSGEWSSEWSGE